MSTIWLDVDDLISYLRRSSRPSGIQRVVLEIGRALLAEVPDRVGFVRRGNGPRDLVSLAWSQVETLLASGQEEESVTIAQVARSAHLMEEILADDPDPLKTLACTQLQVLKAGATFPVSVARYLWQSHLLKRKMKRVTDAAAVQSAEVLAQTAGRRFEDVAKPGDVLLVLGSPWHYDDYAKTVRWVRDDLRMSFALLIHDLIPIRRPQWCDRGIITTFTQWHRMVLPFADQIFANSRATADDVTAYMKEVRLPLAAPVQVVPLGSGFQNHAMAPAVQKPSVEGEYILFVSTIEARKNHELLFRVWRRLLQTMPKDKVPKLVFAGRAGWLVQDLMQQLDNANWLDQHIVHVNNPSDGELNALYRGCLFTVFPSYFEGWGLPITESLINGRPCVASNTTSMPEAGGSFARYFNPNDVNDACRVIKETLEDRAGLQVWTQKVENEFVPTSWTQSARVVLEKLTD
ncbi:glycosyltransferase family 1 protein [Kozakia baliensis]|uniref:glycosyltransferase family 4 protein n=1 Tax=Kozakia baliensis TaxID=153496 RepID=UPI00345C4048